jgi:hypothetical protein
MSAIFAVNNRRFDPLGDRPVPGDAPDRPAYSHKSRGVTYTLDPSASGSYLMTSTADEAAVEVLDVDHAARLIDEIEGAQPGATRDERRAGADVASEGNEQPLNVAKDRQPAERGAAPTRPLHPATEERLGSEAAEGHAMAHRAGDAEAGQQDWLAADEVAMLHVPGQATPTLREVHEHTVRHRDAAGEGERGRRVPGGIGRWAMLAVAATAVGAAAILAYKRRGRAAARP